MTEHSCGEQRTMDQTQVISIWTKHFHLLSHLFSTLDFFLSADSPCGCPLLEYDVSSLFVLGLLPHGHPFVG